MTNLGWFYPNSIFGERAFDANQYANFKKVKYWFGGLDSKRRVGLGMQGSDIRAEERDRHEDQPVTASIKCQKDRRKFYSVGCGTFYQDWTWIDPREFVFSFLFDVSISWNLIISHFIAIVVCSCNFSTQT